jgi:hypothetical protein
MTAPPRITPASSWRRLRGLAAGVSRLLALCLAGALFLALSPAQPAAAGPVDWHEVPASAEGRQWWDQGSLRPSRSGQLSVLSRFQPAGEEGEESGRSRLGDLYVMEIDCGQRLYRDTSVNGIPRFGASWTAPADDELVMAVIQESCEAAAGMVQAG